MRRYQKGMSFLGLVFMFLVIGTLGTIFMKMYPLYMNEMKLKRAVTAAASNPDATASTGALRTALQRWWDVDDIEFLYPTDITINNGGKGKGRTLSYDYYARAELFADISVIVHFKNDIPVSGARGGVD